MRRKDRSRAQHKFKSDWLREDSRGGGGRDRGIMKRGGRGAMVRGGRAGGDRNTVDHNTFGGICFNCGQHGYMHNNCPDKQEQVDEDAF